MDYRAEPMAREVRTEIYHNRLPVPGLPELEQAPDWKTRAVGMRIYLARSWAARSRATWRARGRSAGSKEMAETRGWPPPPNFSASEARFLSAVDWFHGLVPRETLARTADELTLTE